MADLVVGHPAVAGIEVPKAATDYVEFEYTWDSTAYERRRREFARERPDCRYHAFCFIVDGVPCYLDAGDLQRMRLRALK